jgi:prepilin signal peptidase PulO-like enzyme (type II secretory pathway)
MEPRQEVAYALACIRGPVCLTSLLGLTVVFFGAAFARFGWTARLWYMLPLLIVLSVIVVMDLRTKVIPDLLTLPGLVYALLAASLLGSPSLPAASFGAFAGGGIVFLAAVITRGAIGGGDIKLAALLGAALGGKGVLAVLALSQIIGAALALVLLLTCTARWRESLPIGAVISLIGGIMLIGAP